MTAVSLETAGKLKETGYPQESEKYWVVAPDKRQEGGCTPPYLMANEPCDVFRIPKPIAAAPCACEILKQLPAHIENMTLSVFKGSMEYGCAYEDIVNDKVLIHFHNKSLAQACAELWLWCKKEGYIK